jgi:hypothetical protein
MGVLMMQRRWGIQLRRSLTGLRRGATEASCRLGCTALGDDVMKCSTP